MFKNINEKKVEKTVEKTEEKKIVNSSLELSELTSNEKEKVKEYLSLNLNTKATALRYLNNFELVYLNKEEFTNLSSKFFEANEMPQVWSPTGSKLIFVNEDYIKEEPKDAFLSVTELKLRKLLSHDSRLEGLPNQEVGEIASIVVTKELMGELAKKKNKFGKQILPADESYKRPIVTGNKSLEEVYKIVDDVKKQSGKNNGNNSSDSNGTGSKQSKKNNSNGKDGKNNNQSGKQKKDPLQKLKDDLGNVKPKLKKTEVDKNGNPLDPNTKESLTGFGNHKVNQSEINQITKQMLSDKEMKGIGSLSSEMTRLINFTERNSKSLAQLLRREVKKAIEFSKSLTYDDPNFDDFMIAKSLGKKAPIYPTWWNDKPKFRTLMYIDTSGSMSDKELSWVIGDIKSVFKMFKKHVEFEFFLLESDVGEKAKLIRISNDKLDEEELRKVFGDGGTDFSPLINLLEKQNNQWMRRKPKLIRKTNKKKSEIIKLDEFDETFDSTVIFSDFFIMGEEAMRLQKVVDKSKFPVFGVLSKAGSKETIASIFPKKWTIYHK
jgi:hypothetical protein